MEFWKVKNLGNNEVELFIYGEIVDTVPWYSEGEMYVTPKTFLDEIENLRNANTITIRINSPGGDVFVATAIYNQLLGLKAKKTVIIDGICASAATIIAMAGDVVKIPKTALFMIHDPTAGTYGNLGVEDLEKIKDLLVKCKLAIIEAYKTKTSLTDEELSEMMSKTTWLIGEEAVQLGFVDEIIEQEITIQNKGKFCIINNLEIDVSNWGNLPTKIKNIMNLASHNNDVEDKCINNKGGNVAMNVEQVKKDYPDIYNQIFQEGEKQERERFKNIEAIANGVDDDLLVKAKYTEPMSAEQLAFENMKLNNKIGDAYLQKQQRDINNSNVNNVGSVPQEPNNNASNSIFRSNQGILASFMNKDSRRA